MKNRAFLILGILAAFTTLCGGWIFQRQRASATAAYSATLSDDMQIAVRLESGTAEEAADRTALDWSSGGWEQLPVSTRTFRIFTRRDRMSAFLAEDLPQGGVRITEFRRVSTF